MGSETSVGQIGVEGNFRLGDNRPRIVLEVGTCVLHDRFRLAAQRRIKPALRFTNRQFQ